MSQKEYVRRLKNKAKKAARLRSFEGKSVNEIAAQLSSTGQAFLQSPEWKALRLSVIAKYGGKCMCCGATPKRGINVDHIKCRRDFPQLALEEDNLQVLCSTCNKRKGNKHSTDYRAC